MRRALLNLSIFLLAFLAFGSYDSAYISKAEAAAPVSTARTAVTASEVNGTFIQDYGKKFEHICSSIKIKSTGPNKLHVSFDMVWPNIAPQGELMPNFGTAEGAATIVGDTAVYKSNEFGPCKITIKFVKPGVISVTQSGSDCDCGFGGHVYADGVFQKQGARRKRK